MPPTRQNFKKNQCAKKRPKLSMKKLDFRIILSTKSPKSVDQSFRI